MSSYFSPPSYEQLQKDIFGSRNNNDTIDVDSEETKQMIKQHHHSQRQKTLKQNEINKHNPIDLTNNNDNDQQLFESKQSDNDKHANDEICKYIEHLNIKKMKYKKLQENISELISLVFCTNLYKIQYLKFNIIRNR